MKYLQKEQGYSLLIVIFSVVLISVIGLSLLTINFNSIKTSKNEEVDQAVFYIAEAGINYHVAGINNLLLLTFEEVNSQYKSLSFENKQKFDFTKTFTDKANGKIDSYISKNSHRPFEKFLLNNHKVKRAVVNITRSGNEVKFVSTGEIDGKTRKVSQTLKMVNTKLFSTTPISDKSNSDNNTTNNSWSGTLIDDKSYSNKTYIFANTYSINGNFPYGKGSFKDFDSTKLSGSVYESLTNIKTPPNNVQSVKAMDNMKIDKSMVLTQFANVNNGPYTIDASKEDITLYIESGFAPKFNFDVIGSNKVNIVMLGGMTIPNGFQIKSDTLPKPEINLIIPNDRSANFNDDGQGNKEVFIDGNILLGNNPIMLSTKKITITGNIISLTNSDSSLNGSNHSAIGGLCAPYSKLHINGTYELNGGSIVVNHLNINGGGAFDITKGNARNACSSSLFNNPTTNQTYLDYEINSLSQLSTLIEL